ncbi:MAG: hypothetical protein NZ903_02560 [Candidatus Micrarchaeota archaeon]|nr:hypothetical protein [Candidatus Micrarchaeota archaeon]
MKRGVIYTLEAIFSFTFFILLISAMFILFLPSRENVPLYEMVLINDIFQVLELKYHTDLSTFSASGMVTPELKSYLDFIKEKGGYTVFLKFKNYQYPSECEIAFSQKRLIVYFDIEENDVNYFHELTIGLCK